MPCPRSSGASEVTRASAIALSALVAARVVIFMGRTEIDVVVDHGPRPSTAEHAPAVGLD